MTKIDTSNMIIETGKYRGQPYTRLPIFFLKTKADSGCKICQAELDRRGYKPTGRIEVTPHAINKASLSLLDEWKRTSLSREGIFNWILRIFEEAMHSGKILHDKFNTDPNTQSVEKNDIIFVYKVGDLFVTLISIFKK